jgi:hypothetical protein
MKPVKGYKNVTDLVIRPKCCVEGCPRDADLPMSHDEYTDTWSKWMCITHAFEYMLEDEDVRN